jgi:branched-chain amino acid transport system ATP-binding protein
LMSAPRLLVMDQPSFGLDGEAVHHLFQTLSAVHREYRTTILLMEQRSFQALKLAETALLLEKGRLAGEYTAVELMADRSMQAGFLGGARLPQERAA